MMKGFDMFLNGRKWSVAVELGVVCIVVDKTFIEIGGIDRCTANNIRWGRIRLDTGDKIKIIASQIEYGTPPVNVEPLDRKKLLKEYHALREELTKEGLL